MPYICTVSMHFAVRPLHLRGRILPWREIANMPPQVGELRVEESRDAELRRYVRTATFAPPDSMGVARQLLPALLDVHMIGMSPLAFTLAGFERIDGVEYAQSWLVQPA